MSGEILMELNRRYREARGRIAAAAVPDTGIDLKRKTDPLREHRPTLREVSTAVNSLAPVNLFGDIEHVTFRDIERACCSYFGFSRDLVKSHRRAGNLPLARQAIMYLAITKTSLTYPRVGHLLNRDHSTVIYAVRNIARLLLQGDPVTTRNLLSIEKLLQPEHKNVEQSGDLLRDGCGDVPCGPMSVAEFLAESG